MALSRSLEAGGLPQKVLGVSDADLDAAVQRLENLLRTGVEPRFPSHEIRPIPLENGRSVIVLRVRQSWNSPHRVVFREHSKFYSRNSSGKYPLDVAELRAAFTASEGVSERIRRFREERLSKIIAGETPVPLVDEAKVVLHVVPLRSVTTNEHIPLSGLSGIIPPRAMGWTQRRNLDGVVIYSSDPGRSYVQIFRSGNIETVFAYGPEPDASGTSPKQLTLPLGGIEREVIKRLGDDLHFLSTNEAEPPVYVFLSLLGVRNYRLAFRWDRTSVPLDRNDLILPDVQVDDLGANAAAILRSTFDLLWNAFGLDASPSYDADGKWIGA